jgi:hypothetical protein
MQLLAALGGGAFVLVSLVLSIRLLLLASRTRQLPELLVGLTLLLLGGVGYPLSTAARLMDESSALAAALFMVWGALSVVGQGSLALFNWRVFRPGQARARALGLGYGTAVFVLFLCQTFGPGWGDFARAERGPFQAMTYCAIFALGWGGTESLLYHAKLRKRLALGLADAVTTDRLRLWAIAMFSACTISATALALRSVGVPMESPLIGLVVGPLGLVSAGSMWLAFMPPRRYLGWVRARAA